VKEFCHKTKYISRNGRAEGDTWSIRQTGIYEKRNMNTGQSVWILLQPSERVHRRLREGFVARSRSGTSNQMVTTLHAALLIAAHREWAEYLVDINGEVQHLVNLIGKKLLVVLIIGFPGERSHVLEC